MLFSINLIFHKVCGYVYEGEKVPEDYKCPICGVGANLFKQA